MNAIPFSSLEPLISSSLAELEAASGKLRSSFDALIGSAADLASAESAAQPSMLCVPDDEEDESQEASQALSLCEDARFDVAAAIERALDCLAGQERALSDARTVLEQVRESLQLGSQVLSMSMQICPKPGCACTPTKPGK